MISVILYGRNDSHGYNLHKRAAISLNCIAHVLDAPGDEIIFVDYNTPDDFPTFPEAIADTLTDRAKKLLRILRVRPHHHERFRHRTELVALEAIARNVGIRRSHPDNRWVLSTNTDMIFVPRRRASLSQIVAGLPDAYYHLPRFELPEALWESLDRQKPAENIERVGEWGWSFHLNEIARIQYHETEYDAPGDFQLILRSDLWRIHGFDEEMLLSLHLDSNIAKRLSLLPRSRGELVDELFAYHCDHLRQLTLAHAPHGQRNDVQRFFENVVRPDVPAQSQTWGLASESIEELRLGETRDRYLQALRATIPFPMVQPAEFVWTGKVEEQYGYSVDHVLPFLGSSVASYPRSARLGWIGVDKASLWRFAAWWKTMGFTQPIAVHETARWLGPELPPSCVWVADTAFKENSQAFVFDFGQPPAPDDAMDSGAAERLRAVLGIFRASVQTELQVPRALPCRFIGLNTMLSAEVASAFEGRIAVPLTPNSTRIKQGFVMEEIRELARTGTMNCLPGMIVGTAGTVETTKKSDGPAVFARPGVPGPLIYGPYLALIEGRYEAVFEFSLRGGNASGSFDVDVATHRGRRVLAHVTVKPYGGLRRFSFSRSRLTQIRCTLPFIVTPAKGEADEEDVEFRVFSRGTVDFAVTRVVLRSLPVNGSTRSDAVPPRQF
jgi:hypothetical protein